MMNIGLLTEVKWQWAKLVLRWVTVCVLDQLWGVSDLEFLLSPDFCKFQCTTRVSDGIAPMLVNLNTF